MSKKHTHTVLSLYKIERQRFHGVFACEIPFSSHFISFRFFAVQKIRLIGILVFIKLNK